VDEIILINDGKILEYEDKDKVLNGTNFEKLQINHPFIYDVFNSLKSKNLYDDKIPTSPKLATNALSKLLKK
jgi:hypothetical protein